MTYSMVYLQIFVDHLLTRFKGLSMMLGTYKKQTCLEAFKLVIILAQLIWERVAALITLNKPVL